MIYRNVELFNVEEIRETSDKTGIFLSRFPSEVTETLKSGGAVAAKCCAGCEIRFVSGASIIWLTMEAVISDVKLDIYCGEHQYKTVNIEAGKKNTIELRQYDVFSNIDEDILLDKNTRYGHNVWRVCVSSPDSRVIFYDVAGLDGIVRPPMQSECNAIRWLAYGSSITYGIAAQSASNSYIQHAAKLMKAEVMNKGMAGSCRCEKSIADYIKNTTWDILTLELGVNMFTIKTKEFKKRAEYLINSVYTANIDKKIFVITPFMSFYSLGNDKDMLDKFADYTRILKEAVAAINSENLILINGDDILDSISYLGADLLHPSSYGHVRMGENLAKLILQYLEK